MTSRMLQRLKIQGFTLLDDVTIELTPGLNVLSGETGSGKSLLHTALGLLLGARTPAACVRAGHDSALVEAEFRTESGALRLARQVRRTGRGTCLLGDDAVPLSKLAEAGKSSPVLRVSARADRNRQSRAVPLRAGRARRSRPAGARITARLTRICRWRGPSCRACAASSLGGTRGSAWCAISWCCSSGSGRVRASMVVWRSACGCSGARRRTSSSQVTSSRRCPSVKPRVTRALRVDARRRARRG